MSRPYVVHVTEAFGGVETYLRLIVGHWPAPADFGFVLAEDGDLARDLRARGHQVRVVPIPRTRTRLGELRSAFAVRRALRDLAPDVVHLHSSQAGLVGRLAWARPGRPVVYTPHAYYYLGKQGPARSVFLLAEVLLARLFPTRLLATSPSEARRAIRQVRMPEEHVATLTNAVELPPGVEPRDAGSPAVVGLVGRISEQKDIATYLRVVARLTRDPDVAIGGHLVGVGHYAHDHVMLERLMVEAGLDADALEVVPWMPRPDLLAWIETCDVMVLTSNYESFGYTLAEATARGVPVVGTDVDGIRDVVVPGVTGYLSPKGDDAAMHRHIVEMLSDADTYRRFSAAGPQVAAERFDIEVFVRRLAAYYATGEVPPGESSSPSR